MVRSAFRNGRKNRIRAIPTRSGYLLLLILLAMVVAAINYANNMAYIFCFVLFSLMLVGLINSRYNLLGLRVVNIQPQPAFAGGFIRFSLELTNPAAKKCYAIYFSAPLIDSGRHVTGPFAVDPLSTTTAEIALPAARRGLFTLSQLVIISQYPFGFFLAWQTQEIVKEYLIYPQPQGIKPWPLPIASAEERSEGFHSSGGDDFAGIRPYRLGESQHHVDWKSVARGRPLSVKEFTGGGSLQLWFNWYDLTGLDAESRLSQMTKWVIEADKQGQEFGLILPGSQVDLDSSSAHTLDCLQSLALFKEQ